jgi:hypothetical protein
MSNCLLQAMSRQQTKHRGSQPSHIIVKKGFSKI